MTKYFPFLLLIVALVSCENDIEVVRSLAKNEKHPDVTVQNVETLYSDSGKVKSKILAPDLLYFSSQEAPYIEYPKGIHVYIYDDSLNVIAEMSSKYAVYYESKKLCEARTDVVVVNTKGDKLRTEQLFWDMNKKKIYTSKYCSILHPNGNQDIGEHGMDANEDFTVWNFYGPRGTIDIDDPE